jgi:NADH-quinone oxidoreductase subunit E
MLPEELKEELERAIACCEHPREAALDVLFAVQERFGCVSDAAVEEAAVLLGMSALELEELATFYDFIYREPVGKYVIRVCDSAVCWMHGHQSVLDYLKAKLGLDPGATTADGLFTLLPVCCIGYCDRAPAMVINKKVYGQLTPDKIDRILGRLRDGDDSGRGLAEDENAYRC